MRIPKSVLDQVIAHATGERPRECCGLLIGTHDEILELVESRNLSDHSNRFELDPAVHIQARRAARERGLFVTGFYHSHPHSPPAPSPTDLAEAMYDDVLQLIVGVVNGRFEARAYRYSGGSYEPVQMEVRD